MICAFQVLEHAADIRNFIENSLRLLNEKGLLCIAVPNPKCIFVKETPGLLELPPHHCLDINKEFFEYLSKIFPIESHYFWKKERCETNEFMVTMKTKRRLFNIVEKVIKENHSYEVAEIIAVPIAKGSREFFKWIEDSTI